MNILDNFAEIKKLDSSNMLVSIDLLSKQIEQAWVEVKQVDIPADYKKVKKVVVNGMGGSGLGTHIIQSIYFKKLKIPLGNIHSYDLPGMVDKDTLYILSSYSGNTEEVLNTYEQAKRKGAKILAITTGGRLGEFIKQGKILGFVFKPKYNLCNQPRMGIGYAVTGLLGLFEKCAVIKVSDREIKAVIQFLDKLKLQFEAKNLTLDNLAKQTADHVQNYSPVIVAAEFLSGNAHVLANQLNENSKNFSHYFIISELNHHLLEGLGYPKNNPKSLFFCFFESQLYHPRNSERLKITKDVLRKNKINYLSYKLQGKTELTQSFEMLLFGSYVSFYLAMLNNVDPAPIPWVDYFKTQLA